MTADAVADRRLHPATLIMGFLRSLPQTVLAIPAVIGFASDADLRLLLLIAAAGAALSFGLSVLQWLRFRYGVGEDSIVIQSGVLHRQRRVIPLERIQDVDIEQRLLARLLGTARVRIETGGAARDEGELNTVSLAEAHRLRDELRRAHGRPASADAVAVAGADTDEPLLFAMNIRRLLAAGVTNFSLLYIAVLYGGLQYLEPILNFDLWDIERWFGPARSAAEGLSWWVSLTLVAIVILLGVLTGIVRTFAGDYGFRLTRAGHGLRRRRGLFTLSEAVIPLRRVQLALLESGPVARALGWYRLSFQTLSSDERQAGHQVVAPLGPERELRAILAEIGRENLPDQGEYTRVSRRSVLRRAGPILLFFGLLVLGLGLRWTPAFLFLALIPLLAGLIILQWRKHRYAFGPDTLHVTSGFLKRRHWILPFDRLQTVSVTTGPLQRRLKLATIAIDTAGASLFNAPAIVDLDRDSAATLAHRLTAAYREAALARRAAATGPRPAPVPPTSAPAP